MIVTVVEYNPTWPDMFEKESQKLLKILGDNLNHIHHIGSTSVPGLMAKPVIDIMLDVSSLDLLDQKNSEIETLGYEAMGEYGIPGRRYFRKGGDNRTHHIHAFQAGDPNLMRHLAFRDYLVAHPEVARQYGQLKFDIAKACENNIDNYWEQKDPFIKHHEPIAVKWYKAQKENSL
ncbi:MAG: GrpB family protein [Bacteroidetes bacterium]|nr:MAG: GrpB family protein [Bacteroidota bacterium]